MRSQESFLASLLLFPCILRRQEGLLHVHLQEEQKLRSTIYKRDLYVHGLVNKCPEKLTVNFLQVDIQLIRTRDKVLCHQNTIDITLPIDTYFITAFYTDQPDK